MSDRLPIHFDPLRCAESGRLLSGTVAVAAMRRLAELLVSDEGEVEVALECGVDEMGVKFVRGRLTATLMLACQRCLQPMALQVDAQPLLGIVRDNAEAEALPSHYEPLTVDEAPLLLMDVIEDELILSLPIVVLHPLDQCPAKQLLEQEESSPGGRENPFSVLAGLKRNRDSD